MFSDRRRTLFLSIAVWVVFVASLVVTLIVYGANGIKESIGGFLVQFIGTLYWGDRIRNKPSVFIRFRVNDDSPEWERIFCGGFALGAIIIGQLIIYYKLLN